LGHFFSNNFLQNPLDPQSVWNVWMSKAHIEELLKINETKILLIKMQIFVELFGISIMIE